MSGKCCCVTTDACEAPANFSGTVDTKCWNCGDFVCKRCSRLMLWGRWKRKKRICDRCLDDEPLRAQTEEPTLIADAKAEAENETR